MILQNLFLPEPTIPSAEPQPPPLPQNQTPYKLITYRPKTPTSPRSIHNTYIEYLATINSNSPRSIKQRALFTKLKMGAEKFAARAVMHEAGEDHLRKEIKRLIEKSKPDTHRINTTAACVLEKGEVLVELKRKRDEAEAKTAKKVKKSGTLG